ncbi:sulfate transporter 3.1-like isoform X1 [Oryza brachyantha]|uniref:sulfate transporter 3.1-like isoform X1 n=1 Tax=Oryza brachyantha TaxID=4533 RepID=UPI001ADA4434|nr:sulfate transporter 3.1-like isoform X1 [Oryza brachyantha]
MVGQQQVADAAATAARRVPVPPAKPLLRTVGANLMEVFFPDDPFRAVARDQGGGRRALAALRYVFPFLEWLPSYTLGELWADVVAGVTVASLAVPQGISYAKLADLPPIMGLYSSFVPALVYAAMGSSRELAVGTTAVGSLLFAAMLGEEAPPGEKPELYAALAFTATFFAGALQAGLGVLRLGFVVDLLSHAAIVGFMGGAATVVCLQQLKGMLGLRHFTTSTDVVAVVRSVVTQSHLWRWQSVVLGGAILFFLLLVRFIGKRKPRLFLLSAAAPLMSVIFGSLLVYLVHGENHGIQVIGALKKGINPPSARDLLLSSPHTAVALKTGIITGIIGLAEGIAVGRSFAMLKNYNVDGNKEMVAFGLMNIVGSCTSCYLTTGPFSRSAVNSNAGSRTAMSNAVMAAAVALTLLFLTPLFHYTPLVVLSAIIISAMLGVLDFGAAARLWRVDKIDFCVCVGAYLGVVFGSIQIGLAIAVGISILRILLFAARPKTTVLGKIPSSTNFRRMDQYTAAQAVPGLLVLRIDSPIYFTNASYLRERIMRWISYEEDRIKAEGLESLKCLVLDMGAVAGMDTSGTKMLEDLKKNLDRSGVQIALANPGSEIMRKLDKSDVLGLIGDEWIFLTVGEACDYAQRTCKIGIGMDVVECVAVVDPEDMV